MRGSLQDGGRPLWEGREMKKRGNMRIGISAILICGALFMGGCMDKENRFVSYMEEKYGETFIYKEDERGRASQTGYTVSLTNDKFPGKEILVTQVKKEGGEISYLDNYMAYVFHEQAKERIEDVAGEAVDDFWIHFPIPRATFSSEEPDVYSLEDYLGDPLTDINITLLVFGETADDDALQRVVDAFVENGISLACTVVFVDSSTGRDTVTEDNFADYMAKEGWYEKIADFWIKDSGELGYKSWR